MSASRLPSGGVIDRSKPLSFTFEGNAYSGFEGDTLASALLANDVRVVGRSFKYHRHRGIIAAGLDEPNAIMQIGEGDQTIPNLKATGVELYDGLVANPVNAWPSLSFDLLGINAAFKRFIPAGFYYKTFMWPDWHLFEPSIRKAAGLGDSPDSADPDVYDKRFADCDVMVVGGGPAGLAATLAAGRAGASVMLVEQDPLWGGSLLSDPAVLDDADGLVWVDNAIAELTSLPNVQLLNRTMAFGYYDHNMLGLVQRLSDHLPVDQRTGARQRIWKVRATKVIIASGAIERPLVFPSNDRPGVMLASAAVTYLNRYGVAVGQRVVISANNDSAYRNALSLHAAGIEVVAIADSRPQAGADALAMVKSAGIEVMPSTIVSDVRGRNRVGAAELHTIDDDGCAQPGTARLEPCDSVLMAGGWSPAVHLFSQAGGRLRFDEALQAFLPRSAPQEVQCIGSANGDFSLDHVMRDAADAGAKAAQTCGYSGATGPVPTAEESVFGEIRPLWQADLSKIGKAHEKAWLDYQNDVTSSDVKLAIRESFKSVEHVKRYTTLGMASDQGKTSNVNGIGIMEQTLGKPMAKVGTTKFRPPYDPVTIGAFAGRRVGENLVPLRPLAAEESQQALGAKFEDYGWRRAAYYPRPGESEDQAIHREVLAVRNSVGLFDASPLGKIEVFGPDAGEFLTRIYVNNMKTVKPGRCRYGLMLDEHGIVYDDGVLACMSENHYLVGTTSGHAGPISENLQEWLQCEWTDLNVVTQDVTTAWAVMNVNGPKARELLQCFDTDIDLSKDAFPHMHMRSGTLEGVPCRIQRVSFSGELSYEVSVPWSYGRSFWDALMEEGERFGIEPFGVESLMVLRTEKGFLHVGSDTDGMTVPQDLGFGPLIEKKKADFIGRRSIMRPDALRSDRRQLVGLEVVDGNTPLEVGAHVVELGQTNPSSTQGWVTSSCLSPSLNIPTAMALVERGQSRMGEEVTIWDLGKTRRARITKPGGYDPDGERLHV